MTTQIFLTIMIPFVGTALGASLVLFMKNQMSHTLHKILSGFASGVMVAASVWSLLIPSMSYSEDMGKLAFIPAVAGFLLGIFFLLALDHIVPHLHNGGADAEGPKSSFSRTAMMVFAVALHNIPEGMAVGIVFAGLISGDAHISLAGAVSLSIGIAIQNFPEGAIVSMPLKAEGTKKAKALGLGVLSGIVEPLGAFLTILAAPIIMPILPYLLSFAAGAMIYVVVEDLIPEMSQGKHSNIGTIAFALGFSVMMILDVALA